ncbi:MAG: trigger factor [Actinomycetota bacterium]|jgi:trigger factor|nr:trigger factor [Actinomycetota bacterium]
MRSTAEILERNKVKLSVEVDEEELKVAVEDTFRRLQREVQVPGFRPGKAPRRLLEARLGGKAIREDVIRHALPDYYAQAVEEAELDTISAPEIDITSGEDEGPLAFDAIVEVRPKVSVAGRDGLIVTVRSPEVTEEELDSQVERMREQFAELRDVERPVIDGDVVTVDVQATRDGRPVDDLATADFVYEVGSGMLAEGADEKLRGTKAGDIVAVDASDAPGGSAEIKIFVKQVREKVLPDADDAWASDASEFETIGELRADLRRRMTALRTLQARVELRERAIEALAGLVQEEMPDTLVDEATQRLLASFIRELEARKIGLDQYLAARDQSADQLLAEMKAQALEQVKADLALRAVAEAEGLEVTDEELASEIQRLADESDRRVSDVARQVAEGVGLERLRSELRSSKAVQWLLDHVEVVDEQGKAMDRALLLEHDVVSDGAGAELETVEYVQEGGVDGDTVAEVVDHDNETEEAEL